MIGKKGIYVWIVDSEVIAGIDIFNVIGRIIVDCKVTLYVDYLLLII